MKQKKEKKKKKRKKKINKKNKNNMYKFDLISVGPLEFYAPCPFNFMLPLQRTGNYLINTKQMIHKKKI